jgi:hypothetical protein
MRFAFEEPAQMTLTYALIKNQGIGNIILEESAKSGCFTILSEDFEGVFPSGEWEVYGNPTWDEDDYKPHSGNYSVWCAGSSLDPKYSNYLNNMNAWMIYGPFDLSDACTAEMTFWTWFDTEVYIPGIWPDDWYDWMGWGASINCEDFYGYVAGGISNGWLEGYLDFTDVPFLGNICGYPEVCVAFWFVSDSTVTFEGVFVDDILIEKCICGINMEKSTNGEDADVSPGPTIALGSEVTWEYVITNAGDKPLSNINVTDNKGVPISYISGDANSNNLLDVSEVWIYRASGTAQLGQYSNIGTATGKYEGQTYIDTDPSHYFCEAEPDIDIEKYTNGSDADVPMGPILFVGQTVNWEYEVTNTGNVTLTNINVTDSEGVTVDCPKDTLTPGESMTCTASGTVVAGQYMNIGTVTASYGGQVYSDEDYSHYYGIPWGDGYNGMFDDLGDLESMRLYRDKFLVKDPLGREYVDLLYKNSGESLKVLIENPELISKARKLIQDNKHAIHQAASGEVAEINNTDEIISFLDEYSAKAPVSLKLLIRRVKFKMLEKRRRGEFFFGFKLK